MHNRQTTLVNIREQCNRFIIKLQESLFTLESKDRIGLMLRYIDTMPNDILLDIGGNTGKLTEAYARKCKEIVILEPKHSVIEYGRKKIDLISNLLKEE